MTGLDYADGLERALDGTGYPGSIAAPRGPSSPGLVASFVAKSGAGILYGISGYSNKAAAQFIHVFDATVLPANGAVPVFVVNVAASPWNFSIDLGEKGQWFYAGVVLANSSTAGTLTIGSADTFFQATVL